MWSPHFLLKNVPLALDRRPRIEAAPLVSATDEGWCNG